jgi:hypothetical protein
MVDGPRSIKIERLTIPIAEICGAILVNPTSLKTMSPKAVSPRAESPKVVVIERGSRPGPVSPLIETTAHSSATEGRLPALVT